MPGLKRRHHASTLRHAQDLWDLGCREEAVAGLELLVPKLQPRTVATDAAIIATLATYYAELGDPRRGLALLGQVPLDDARLTEIQLLCLGARCTCRAAAGDAVGARSDRERICSCDPKHPALAVADIVHADDYADSVHHGDRPTERST
jgi:hypothetical protein